MKEKDTVTKVEVLQPNEENKFKLQKLIEELNEDYPIPLVEKINIVEYANKILSLGIVVVCIISNELVGFVSFYANNYTSYEGAYSLLGVAREFREKGIATMLFNKSFEVMRKSGMTSAFSFTHKDNKKAINFHIKMGFKIDESRLTSQKYNISFIRKL
jgi:ribosomal protein S18 acetylase RimI-like enzyme